MPDSVVVDRGGRPRSRAGADHGAAADVGLYGSTSVQPDACSEVDPYSRVTGTTAALVASAADMEAAGPGATESRTYRAIVAELVRRGVR